MTQRIFDVNNKEDIDWLWSKLDTRVVCIKPYDIIYCQFIDRNGNFIQWFDLFKFNWHDKTEITRPIQEATKADIGKLCAFWDDEESYIGILVDITHIGGCQSYRINLPTYKDLFFLHCRRLTKQEIEELC